MAQFPSDKEAADALAASFQQLRQEIGKVIVGQDEVVRLVLTAVFSQGHSLLVGVPGLAKTLLIQTIADSLDLSFNRIQFTPDLMPSDITGTDIIEEDPGTGRRVWTFVKGPIFANVLLADEINRTPPKTQAALLESMQEYAVTVAGQRYPLQRPFFVLATQNPIEQEGTYPLPEAQQDRFMFNIKLGYPSYAEELNIVKNTTSNRQLTVNKVLHAADIQAFQELVRRVPVADNVVEYAVSLVQKTRPGTERAAARATQLLEWGAGPRASQHLIVGAKCNALLTGKYSPDIEDVRAVAVPILRHRLVRNFKAEAEGIGVEQIVKELL
ncbi:MAG: MoxR family ATPase [Hymenobacter sp.]